MNKNNFLMVVVFICMFSFLREKVFIFRLELGC